MTDPAARGRTPEAEPRIPVSVLIAARDEEETLPGALAGLSGWAAEVVVVVDPRTRDATREIAAAAGSRVFEHPFETSSAQLGWGLGACARDWVFVLDADERLTPVARASIADALAAPRHAAYGLARRNVAFGRALRFGDWGGDRVVRLLDRRRVRLVGGMHWRVEADSVGRLRGAIQHHTLRSLEQYLPKVMDYATRGAAQAASRTRAPGGATVGGRALWRFVRGYVLRLGFLDGVPGLIVAGLSASGSFFKWALAWERATKARPRT